MTTPASHSRIISIAAVIDLVLVLVFVFIGRGSHEEAFSLAGILTTAWPFVAGLAAGWLLARAWRAPLAIRRTGLQVWASVVVVGVVLRALSGQGVAVSFVIVTVIVLGVFLLGWRGLAVPLTRMAARSTEH